VYHPKRRDYVNPKFLGAEVVDMPRDQDPRPRFAEWLCTAQNPWFARVMANRVWYWLLGRGIVHEPDDFRSTNPPSNPDLLDYLTQEFVGHQFDVKHLFRLILNSRTFQLSSRANEFNRADRANFSRYYVRRLGAEPLLDAVCQVTGTSDQFASWIPVPPTIMPANSRAIQVYDGDIKNPLLDVFGRPLRDTPYECERKLGGSVRQSLHLVNSDHFEGKVAGSPKLQQLFQANKPDAEIIDELYLATLARLPTAEERQKVVDYLSGAGKTVAPQFETEKQSAEQTLAKMRAALEQAKVAYDVAEKAAQEAEAAAAAASTAATDAANAQANAAAAVAAPRQAADAARKALDDLLAGQQQPAEARLAQLSQVATEAATAKTAAEKALADAGARAASAQQAYDAAEKAAQEAEARAKATAEDAGKSNEEKAQSAADAAAQRKSADDAKTVLSQSQQDQQQAQAGVDAAAGRLAQAEAEKKSAEEALAMIRQQVSAATQAHEAAAKAAQDAETAAAQAKIALETAQATHAAAAAAATENRTQAGEAQSLRDKSAADEQAAATAAATAVQKLAEATAALKPPRDRAFQDLLWALMNTKEFLFLH
jgi:hypothetical protein